MGRHPRGTGEVNLPIELPFDVIQRFLHSKDPIHALPSLQRLYYRKTKAPARLFPPSKGGCLRKKQA